MGELKHLGPRPLALSDLIRLVRESPLHYLVDEDRLRPARYARTRDLVWSVRDVLDERHPVDMEERTKTAVSRLACHPDDQPVQALEDQGTPELLDRMENLWGHRESDAWNHGLLLGLLLGARTQSTVEGDHVRPIHLMTVVESLLDVADHFDTEEAMQDAARDERHREWVASGKTWWDFCGWGRIFGEDDEKEAG